MTRTEGSSAEPERIHDLSLTPSPRLRRSPYFDATIAHGARAFTVYNHMLLPTAYAGSAAEYEALVSAVTIWDVGAQRQVEMVGVDAAALAQHLTTRDVTAIPTGRARYTLLCNPAGGIINDPVMLRLEPDRFWLSLADRDVLLWAQAVAHERGLDVVVREPDVAPVQIQGPRSGDLVRDLLGHEIAALPYYHLAITELDEVPLVVSRTGWSGELGFEIYLLDGARGTWLWERLFTVGASYGAQPAAPNQIRRIEAGILSYGVDIDDTTNPYEAGLGRLVDLDGPDDFIGKTALRRIDAEGPTRRLVGAVVDGAPIGSWNERADAVADDAVIGAVTSMAYSPRLEKNLALAIVGVEHSAVGDSFGVVVGGEVRTAAVVELPFVRPVR